MSEGFGRRVKTRALKASALLYLISSGKLRITANSSVLKDVSPQNAAELPFTGKWPHENFTSPFILNPP
jgi:hypothetical protein